MPNRFDPHHPAQSILEANRRISEGLRGLAGAGHFSLADQLSQSGLARTMGDVREHLAGTNLPYGFSSLREAYPEIADVSRMLQESQSSQLIREAHERMQQALGGTSLASVHAGIAERLHGPNWVAIERERTEALLQARGYWGEAERLSRMASQFALPPALAEHAMSYQGTMERIASAMAAHGSPSFLNPFSMPAFAGASALSNILQANERVSAQGLLASQALSAFRLPEGSGISGLSPLLDAAGLGLPFSRHPGLLDLGYFKFRPLPSAKERRARIQAMKKRAKPKPHHLRAFRRVHDAEMLLRRFIERAFTEMYGPSWAAQRLPVCGCRDLLNRTQKRGGTVLENADWGHYLRIMTHPEHFEQVFAFGFDDVAVLQQALSDAAPFRHSIMHFRNFTPENYVALVASLSVLEQGLADMIIYFPIDDDGDGDEFEVLDG